MSDINENEETDSKLADSKLVKVNDWKAEMIKRIKETKIYYVIVTPTPLADGSVNFSEFIEFHKILEDHLNYQPIKLDLTLLDNLLKLHLHNETLKEFKNYLEKQENENKKVSDLSDSLDKVKIYHRDVKKCSRRSRYSKNLLLVIQKLREYKLRETFFRITKLTKTDLCDKDISSIIDKFVKT
ncbi:26698_t:CDS:1, partial [Gigaspora margarita]